ncbi:MAG: hypothetical protein HOP23_02965 [Methylococcaceae bacterium]|nr:hypothetical protein [Methylococcaceae bacterium]
MSSKLQIAIKSVLAGTALSLASAGAYAANAVTIDGGASTPSWIGLDNVIGSNETISTIALGNNKNTYTDNPVLENSSWGHAGRWFTFQLTSVNDITIRATDVTGAVKNAFTVWASGANQWDGGTLYSTETNGGTSWSNAPHSFNPTGQLGSPGTYWMSSPTVVSPGAPDNVPGVSNMLETLAYVNSGNAHSGNDWGETILSGVNQVSTTGTYFSGVTGSTGLDFAEMTLLNLQPGWYTIFQGGADNSVTGTSTFNLTVSSVPVPAAVYLFGSALAGLMATGRRKRLAA